MLIFLYLDIRQRCHLVLNDCFILGIRITSQSDNKTTASISTVKKRFQRFQSGNFDLEDVEKADSLKKIYNSSSLVRLSRLRTININFNV